MAVTIDEMNVFVDTLKGVSNYNFTDYSEKSFCRRLERILVDNKIDFNRLLYRIKHDKIFLEKIVKDITVNTTELFRDPQIWHLVKYRILPKLEFKSPINILHTGCSTGQELYSMLILLSEMNMLEKANVIGTDINEDVLDIARRGVYKYRHNLDYINNFNKVIRENPYNFEEFNDVPYTKYFDIDKVKDLMRVKPFLTRKPVFKKQDLVKDENIFAIKFDIIFCRNVLIYFNSNLQNKTFEIFYDLMIDGGALILGAHESMLGPVANRFIKKGKYYIKRNY